MSAADRRLRHEWNDERLAAHSMGTADVFGKKRFQMKIYTPVTGMFMGADAGKKGHP
jgi:hypothetical protein